MSPKTPRGRVSLKLSRDIHRLAVELRERCLASIRECEDSLWLEAGDAVVTVNGNDRDPIAVLYVLNAIGVPGCKP